MGAPAPLEGADAEEPAQDIQFSSARLYNVCRRTVVHIPSGVSFLRRMIRPARRSFVPEPRRGKSARTRNLRTGDDTERQSDSGIRSRCNAEFMAADRSAQGLPSSAPSTGYTFGADRRRLLYARGAIAHTESEFPRLSAKRDPGRPGLAAGSARKLEGRPLTALGGEPDLFIGQISGRYSCGGRSTPQSQRHA